MTVGHRHHGYPLSHVALAILMLLAMAAVAEAADATYHVDGTHGDDSNTGTSVSAPWKTIQKAFDSATPGSTVYILAGTYREGLTLNVSGSAAQGFITFRNHGPDRVVLDATGITASPLINITDKRYVRIEGLEIVNYVHDHGIAISISGGSDHVEIRQNKLSHIVIATDTRREMVGSGTFVWNVPIRVTGTDPVHPADRIVIDGNDLSDCKPGWGEALTVAANSTNWEITDNRLVDCGGIDAQGHFGESPDPATDQARNGVIRGNVVSDSSNTEVAIYVDGAKDVVVEHNIVMRNPWGIVVSCEREGKTASGIVVRNNLLYDNGGGIAVGGWVDAYGRVTDSQVVNNTLAGNRAGLVLTLASNIRFTNNIVSLSELAVYNVAGNDDSHYFNHNLYDQFLAIWKDQWCSFDCYRERSSQEAQSVLADPLFMNRDAKDFRVRGDSPAINAGDPTLAPGAAETDVDGKPRLVGDRVDIGAAEHQE